MIFELPAIASALRQYAVQVKHGGTVPAPHTSFLPTRSSLPHRSRSPGPNPLSTLIRHYYTGDPLPLTMEYNSQWMKEKIDLTVVCLSPRIRYKVKTNRFILFLFSQAQWDLRIKAVGSEPNPLSIWWTVYATTVFLWITAPVSARLHVVSVNTVGCFDFKVVGLKTMLVMLDL